jgi:hypothetical protein
MTITEHGTFAAAISAATSAAFADVVQHAAEAELLLQAQHGEDVVGAVRVVVHDALALEHLDQRFEAEVAFGQLARITGRGGDLLLVVACAVELRAHQRRRLAARAGERRVALRIGAVRHLDAARVAAVGVLDGDLVDGAAVAQLQVDRLARQQVARARHHVGGGDAAGLRLLDAGIARDRSRRARALRAGSGRCRRRRRPSRCASGCRRGRGSASCR